MRRQASTTIIFVTVLLDLLGFGMVLPLLPLYAADPRFNASTLEIGWLMAIYSLMQFLFTPLWGRLSDRIGRRPVLIVGLFGSSLSYLLYGLAGSLTTLFVARAAAGIMGANIAAAQAAMADLTPPERRTQAMGMIGVAFSLGFVLGPALGGILSRYGMEVAPLVAAVVTGLNAIAAVFWLAETLHTPLVGSLHHPLSWRLWLRVRRMPAAMTICILMGLFVTLFAGFEISLPLWGAEHLAWSMPTAGWMFAYVGVVMVVAQGVVVRRLAAVIGEKKTAISGMAATAAGVLLLMMVNHQSTWLLFVALAFVSVGAGLVHPSLSSLVSLNTEAYRQGVMMGLFQSLSALGRVLGPIMAGAAYAVWNQLIFVVFVLGISGVAIILSSQQQRILDARQKGSSP
ncbi:MAG: MFS transporter [Magnetococcales bacterium]|nr:MFS transporter [Magnetococcales bacterium]